jgi:hypothetical protein
LLKMDSKKKTETPKIDLPEEASGLFLKNHDRILADSSLSDKDVILLAIYLIERQNKKAGVDYTECKQLFTSLGRKGDPNYKVNIHNARKESLIEQKDSVLYFLSGGLKRIRGVLGEVEKAPVYVIKSGQSFTAIRLLEEFLTQEIQSGELSICDSYVSSTTLFPFSVVVGKVRSIRILTTNVQDSDKFREYKNKMQKETGIVIEVKLSSKIHDRYLITGDKCWAFGASIKDLGNKDTTIREISEVTASMKDLFQERWNESPDFA